MNIMAKYPLALTSLEMVNYDWYQNLTLWDSRKKTSATVSVIYADLTVQEETLKECRLTLQVSIGCYQHIDAHALFNLNPEFRGPFSNGCFQPDRDVQLEITLQPELLPRLWEQAKHPVAVVTYLSSLGQDSNQSQSPSPTTTEPNPLPSPDPLLNTENWFCLSVQQTQATSTTNYRTFWSYVNPATFNQSSTSSVTVADGIVNYVKDWTESKFTETTQEATNQLLQGISKFFDDLETWIDEDIPDDEPGDTDISLLETVISFLEDDDWSFARLDDPSLLRLAFQGENGRWNCYAKVREETQEFIFYSICPILAPEDKRSELSEFITRANYGMVIGNFEMDFTDGEIRYKTSVGVEGERLSMSQAKRIIYTNIAVMDQYLPGIIDVVENAASPALSIARIEDKARNPYNNIDDGPEQPLTP